MATDSGASWTALVSAALLGTERQAPPWPPRQDALGRVLASLDPVDREGALLAAAGAHSLYRRAGAVPARVPDKLPAMEPAAPSGEDLPRVGSRASRHLGQMCEGLYRPVLGQWLESARGKRVPEELLPALLDLAARDKDLRAAVIPVLGRRGLWLARLNPDWCWAVGEAERKPEESTDLWQTGTFDVRLGLLRQLRRSDPALGRQLVQSTWGDDDADARQEFLAVLLTGLGPADEDFLESALDDRSKKVRLVAADLLSRLAGSKLAARMIERVRPLVAFTAKTGLLAAVRGRKSRIEVRPPAECDKDMQRDGIEPKPPAGGRKVGEKAWWLQQIVAAVPASYWSREPGVEPAALIAAAKATDWSEALLSGWLLAAERHRDGAWAEAILEEAPEAGSRLLPLLDDEAREAFVGRWLKANAGDLEEGGSCLALLEACGHRWSQGFGRLVLGEVQACARRAGGAGTAWRLRQALPMLAVRFPVKMLEEAGKGWPAPKEGQDAWSEAAGEFLAMLQFRRDMLEALKEIDHA